MVKYKCDKNNIQYKFCNEWKRDMYKFYKYGVIKVQGYKIAVGVKYTSTNQNSLSI